MKFSFILLTLFIFQRGCPCFGGVGDNSTKTRWKLQLGASMSHLEDRFSVPPGFASKVSQVQGLLGASKVFRFSQKLDFKPELFVLLPWRKGSDGTTLAFTSHLGFLLGYRISKRWSFNLGSGLLWESYSSKGADIVLDNGTGNSTFYTPSRWTQVILPTASLFLEWHFKEIGASIQFGAAASEFAKRNKRSFQGIARLMIDL